MNAMIRTLMGLSLVALIAGPAAAQGRGGFGGRGGLSGLLANESVQKELKLDDKQIEKAKEVAEKIREERQEKFQGLQDLQGQERMTKMMELTHELNTSTLKLAGEFLKPDQITRLKQISYQQSGPMAFNDPEVAKKLNLTEAQKTDIREIQQAAREKMPSREDAQSDPEGARKKRAEVNKETLAQISSKLNDEQRKTWNDLIGSPFEVKYEPRNN